jgi:hypothetical protein
MTRGVYIAPLGTLEGMALYVSARRPSGSARESGSLQQLPSDRPTRDDTRSEAAAPYGQANGQSFMVRKCINNITPVFGGTE